MDASHTSTTPEENEDETAREAMSGSPHHEDLPDELSTQIAVTLFALSSRLTSFSQAFAELHGVSSPAAFNAMTIIEGAGEPLPPSVIAERMIVSRPTITGVVDTLERRGHVRVLRHPDDRRKALIALTPAGREVVQHMSRALHRIEKEWMSCLTPEEREVLLSLLLRLLDTVPEV